MGAEELVTEFIDDRSLRSVDEDRFEYRDFLAELEQLALTVETPGNVALFGSWGAGKTGMANLLKERLNGVGGVRVAVFDAFKYAEAPLRRQFLSQLAQELGLSNRKFKEDLYKAKTTSTIGIPLVQFVRLLGYFLAVTVVLQLLTLLVIGVASWITDEGFGDLLRGFYRAGAVLVFAPASLIAILGTLAGKGFNLEQTVQAPSSEEEFESLFAELVKASKAERLIVFIDELDRCSAEEVVSTLETIKTFLYIDKCVFIVAADQQVLEQALTQRARQQTPADTANPYYSAGSAYIDKIFQYQVSLPRLMGRRLSTFALQLVEERQGLWGEVDAREVMGALIPTHISSPRRVKTLINSFVMAYRLAARRNVGQEVSSTLPQRGPELAKLVCLRSEFPLFAVDLTLDPRLPEYVLMLASNPPTPLPQHVPLRVQERARQYANHELPVDDLLVDLPDHQDEASMETSSARLSEVRAVHGEQLIDYLYKTSHIPGPRRDLIYLESPGSMFGLNADLAERLEDDAVNGRAARVALLIETLDAGSRAAAIQFLAQVVREAQIGIEARNAVASLLQAAGASPTFLEGVCDEVADALATHLQRFDLQADDLAGALAIGLGSTRSVGGHLLDRVLERDEVLTDDDLALTILDNASRLLPERLARLGEVLEGTIVRSSTSAAAIVALHNSVSEDDAVQLLRRARAAAVQAVMGASDG